MEKKFWVQIWAKDAKIGPETRFFPFFQVWLINFPLNCRVELKPARKVKI